MARHGATMIGKTGSSGGRSWRLNITANQGNGAFTGIQEVEMRESIGGVDVTASGTAFASSSFAGLPASNAFDDTTAEWANNGDGPAATLGCDFGVGVIKKIVEIQLTPRSTLAQTISAFAFQLSLDNATWTTTFTIADSVFPWTAGVPRRFSGDRGVTAANQAWRINATATDGGAVLAIAELQFRTSLGGASVTTGGDAYASTVNGSGGGPEAVFDGSTSTFWADTVGASWIGYRFPAPQTIVQVAITARTVAPNQSPAAFTIEKWNGSSWATAATVPSSTGWASGETRLFNI